MTDVKKSKQAKAFFPSNRILSAVRSVSSADTADVDAGLPIEDKKDLKTTLLSTTMEMIR